MTFSHFILNKLLARKRDCLIYFLFPQIIKKKTQNIYNQNMLTNDKNLFFDIFKQLQLNL